MLGMGARRRLDDGDVRAKFLKLVIDASGLPKQVTVTLVERV